MLLLRITVLEFAALLQHSIALYCVLPENMFKLMYSQTHVFITKLKIGYFPNALNMEFNFSKILLYHNLEDA